MSWKSWFPRQEVYGRQHKVSTGLRRTDPITERGLIADRMRTRTDLQNSGCSVPGSQASKRS
ncbi:mCG1033558 [Mus musculus]|nr:mCG1033558 [Mus musculus]